MLGRSLFRLCGKFASKPVEGMASAELLAKLENRAVQAEKLIEFLKGEVAELHKQVQRQSSGGDNLQQYEKILSENKKLKLEVEEWKTRLMKVEEKLGVIQIKVDNTFHQQIETAVKPSELNSAEIVETPKQGKKIKKGGSKAAGESQVEKSYDDDDLCADVGRLDLRIGKIVNVKKHPDATSLYVEEVDIGEGKLITVVSGLVNYVPVTELENRMVVLLCNLKPAKIRGVLSEAMVLCASTPDKVEVLIPPAGAAPGDRVMVEGYDSHPDPVSKLKKKTFEMVSVDLKTDLEKRATYKGSPFYIEGKGIVTTSSLVDVIIK